MTYTTKQLRHIKQGDTFKRKPDALTTFIRGHYNRKDFFGPANFSCVDSYDVNREIFLKPSTLIYVEA